jgi:hypothetical protein
MPEYNLDDDIFKAQNILLPETAITAVVKPLTVLGSPRKPKDLTWVRVHPDTNFRRTPVALLGGVEGQREEFLVFPKMVALCGIQKHWELAAATTLGGDFFIWKVPVLRSAKDRDNRWNVSHREIYAIAKTEWVRMYASQEKGLYEYDLQQGQKLPDFNWPADLAFEKMQRASFGDRVIVDENSPRYKELKGIAL